MPSFADLAKAYVPTVAPAIVNGILGRRAAGGAVDATTGGINSAMSTLQGGENQAAGTLANVYGEQKNMLNPYQQFGQSNMAALQQGLQPGGGLIDPFTQNPNFSRNTDFSGNPDFTRNTDFKFDPNDLNNDPGYQFRLQQGQKAIEAGATANGTRFSGATLKSLNNYAQGSASQEYQNAYSRAENTFGQNYGRASDQFGQNYGRENQQFADNYARANEQFGQNYNRSENQFRQNEAIPLAALQQATNTGLNATNEAVSAGGTYGANLSKLQETTAQQVGQLQQELGEAQAAGDVAKANQLTGMIDSISSGITDTGLLQKLGLGGTASTLAKAAPGIAGGIAGPALSQLAAGAGAIGSADLPLGLEAGGGIGAAAGPSIAAPAMAGGTGGGIASALGALATNPITWAAGAALGIGVLWSKSQAHHEANDWVQHLQNPFDEQMHGIDTQVQSGSLPQDQANQLRQIAIADYLKAADNFASKGSDQKTVVKQAMETFNKSFAGYVSTPTQVAGVTVGRA